MRKLMGIPFVSLFLLFFAVQLFTGNSGLAVSLAVLAGFGLQRQKPLHVFLICALAMGLGWAIMAYYLDDQNNGILTGRMLGLFPVNNRFALILLSSCIGALWAGTGGLAGVAIGRIFQKNNG